MQGVKHKGKPYFSKHVTPSNLFRQCADGDFLSYYISQIVLWILLTNQEESDKSHEEVDTILRRKTDQTQTKRQDTDWISKSCLRKSCLN